MRTIHLLWSIQVVMLFCVISKLDQPYYLILVYLQPSFGDRIFLDQRPVFICWFRSRSFWEKILDSHSPWINAPTVNRNGLVRITSQLLFYQRSTRSVNFMVFVVRGALLDNVCYAISQLLLVVVIAKVLKSHDITSNARQYLETRSR